MKKIMIIEDDLSIREELMLLLKNDGYCPLSITDFTNISEQILKVHPDLILLDIGLPGQDGFSLCVKIRKTVSVPIIFVTCRYSGL